MATMTAATATPAATAADGYRRHLDDTVITQMDEEPQRTLRQSSQRTDRQSVAQRQAFTRSQFCKSVIVTVPLHFRFGSLPEPLVSARTSAFASCGQAVAYALA